MFVLKASASDPDVGANGEISYTLHGPDADKFHLEHRTGMAEAVWGQNIQCLVNVWAGDAINSTSMLEMFFLIFRVSSLTFITISFRHNILSLFLTAT